MQRSLLAGVANDPELLAMIQERANDAGAALWLTVLGRAVARGEARPEALHPRVATVAVVLLRNEYVTRGIPSAPDHVLVEIVDEVYVPLVRGRGVGPGSNVPSTTEKRVRRAAERAHRDGTRAD